MSFLDNLRATVVCGWGGVIWLKAFKKTRYPLGGSPYHCPESFTPRRVT